MFADKDGEEYHLFSDHDEQEKWSSACSLALEQYCGQLLEFDRELPDITLRGRKSTFEEWIVMLHDDKQLNMYYMRMIEDECYFWRGFGFTHSLQNAEYVLQLRDYVSCELIDMNKRNQDGLFTLKLSGQNAPVYLQSRSRNVLMDFQTHLQYFWCRNRYPVSNVVESERKEASDINDTAIMSAIEWLCMYDDIYLKWVQGAEKKTGFFEHLRRVTDSAVTMPDVVRLFHECVDVDKSTPKSTPKCRFVRPMNATVFSRNRSPRRDRLSPASRSELISDRETAYYGFFEPHAVAEIQFMDSIHCFLREYINNSVVHGEKAEQEHDFQNVAIENGLEVVHVEDSKSQDHIQPQPNLNKKFELNPGKFGFGQVLQFDEYFAKDKFYVSAIFPSLREEVTENKIAQITELEFYDVYIKAIGFVNDGYLASMRAHANIQASLHSGIMPGERLRLNHVICIMLYTDFTNLQYRLKQVFRKNARQEELRQIAIWTRYLHEICRFYGEPMSRNDKFFCGLSCRLMFSKWDALFSSPMSTTTSKSVALSFASQSGSGIILQLQPSYEGSGLFFPAYLTSRYHHEEEMFIADARLTIDDILCVTEDGQLKSCHNYVLMFWFVQRILRGNILYEPFVHWQTRKRFRSRRKHRQYLIWFVMMLDKFLSRYSKKSNDDVTDPNVRYMISLFNHTLDSFCKPVGDTINPEFAIWLNKPELIKFMRDSMYNYWEIIIPVFWDLRKNRPGPLLKKCQIHFACRNVLWKVPGNCIVDKYAAGEFGIKSEKNGAIARIFFQLIFSDDGYARLFFRMSDVTKPYHNVTISCDVAVRELGLLLCNHSQELSVGEVGGGPVLARIEELKKQLQLTVRVAVRLVTVST